jgi:hypothetical protein
VIVALVLLAMAVGFALGRGDGHAFAGVFASGIAGLLLGAAFVGSCKVVVAHSAEAEAKARLAAAEDVREWTL